MIASRTIRKGSDAVPAPAVCRMRRICALLLVLMLPACGGPSERDVPAPEAIIGRFITPELWAGSAISEPGGWPAASSQLMIRGPFTVDHPVDGRPIRAYERVALVEGGRKRQLLTVTQNGAGLGRVLDERTGLPERRFADDVVFPNGVWKQGEVREFEATEVTLLGPALRQITLEILEIDHVHDGVAHSLRFRLTIRDEAHRVLGCETSVYSPGLGLVAFAASGNWQGCAACPCAG